MANQETDSDVTHFFTTLRETVALMLAEPRYNKFVVQIEKDFRGTRADTLTIRVLKNPPEGKQGIVSEPMYVS